MTRKAARGVQEQEMGPRLVELKQEGALAQWAWKEQTASGLLEVAEEDRP